MLCYDISWVYYVWNVVYYVMVLSQGLMMNELTSPKLTYDDRYEGLNIVDASYALKIST